MELNNNVFRVYFSEKKGIVEAVEVLKKSVKAPMVKSKNHLQ